MVIIPKNYNLFSVNIFVALTGLYQLLRIFRYEAGVYKLQALSLLEVNTHFLKEISHICIAAFSFFC